MFTRTNAGMSSEHLFYDVDWVVYCEGSSQDDVSSLDEVFWTKVLGDLGIRCRCKSMGSKPDLLKISEKVVNGDTDRIVVVLDRDYDHMTGDTIEHPRIIYTLGYSWESDACQEFSIRRIVQLFANIIHCETIAAEFEAYRNTLSQQLKRVVALDFKYYNHREPLFDRGKPLSIVDVSGDNGPSIRKRMLLHNAKRMADHQPASLPKGLYENVCGFRDFFGKVVSRLVYQWFVRRTSRLPSRRRVSYEGTIIAIVDSMTLSTAGIARNDYYARKVAALP